MVYTIAAIIIIIFSIIATTTLREDQSRLTNRKEEEKQKEAIATSKTEAIRPKVLAVPSATATNETSGLMGTKPLTKGESWIASKSSSTKPLSEITPTNISVEKEPSEKIAAEKAVTKAEAKIAASSTSGNIKIKQQQQERPREQETEDQTLSHVETEAGKWNLY
jgi:hypothetical protein